LSNKYQRKAPNQLAKDLSTSDKVALNESVTAYP